MNIKKLKQTIGIAGAAFALLFGIGILSVTTASAQRRDDNRDNRRNDDRDYNRTDNDRYDDRDDDDDRYDDRNDNDRDYNRNNRGDYAMRQAYRFGFSEGLNDARSGRRPNAQRAAGQAMRRMNNGNYSRRDNGRNFRQDFREAFIRGYIDAYNRYNNRDDRWNNGRNRRNGY